MYQMHFLCTSASFSVPAVGIFSRSRLKGTQGGRLDTTAQVWVPPGPRGARSGRSKSLDLASKHGIAFRPAEPSKVMKPPKCHFRCICYKCHTSPQNVYTLTQPRYNSSRASSVTLGDGHEQHCFKLLRVCECARACVPSNPGSSGRNTTKWRAISTIFFVLCCLRLQCICVPTRVPRSLHVVAATAASLHGLPFVTATTGASVCARMCVRVCHPEHNLRTLATHLFFFLKFKGIRAADMPSNSSGTAAANLT